MTEPMGMNPFTSHSECLKLPEQAKNGVPLPLYRFQGFNPKHVHMLSQKSASGGGSKPPPYLEIVEIQGRTEQGFQNPFKCIASDGELYFVKGRQTNRASQCNEWICANLARELSLPVPPFRIVNVSEELLSETPADWKEIGLGPAFGSRNHPGCTWFERSNLPYVPLQLKALLFAFDWWVQNIDRSDGNPNLLWDASQGELVVIDHNLAFDPDLSPEDFMAHHVFRECWDALDLVTRDQLQFSLCKAMDAAFEMSYRTIPQEWFWNNLECDVPAKVDFNAIESTLSRCKLADFWRFA